ncbi:hypothetical protein [uncultured Halopseudomonas sp.]|uniref:phage tail terminator protein n=1 Tax=uncultured Halopseudomonas sp. TaxID=2901193 RepID=UPI0030EDDF07|tara:strand:- start:28759 stop:29202 length:444 start_codon:yes stop_codon:yes gene_type:complete
MSFAPLDMQPIIEHLRASVPALDRVEGAAEYNQVKALSDFRIGTAYVVLANERNPVGAAPQARRAASADSIFGVVLVARNYRDQSGAEALQDLGPLIGGVRQALVEWDAPGMDAIRWLQGDAVDSDASRVLWIDVFTTTHVLRGTKS